MALISMHHLYKCKFHSNILHAGDGSMKKPGDATYTNKNTIKLNTTTTNKINQLKKKKNKINVEDRALKYIL